MNRNPRPLAAVRSSLVTVYSSLAAISSLLALIPSSLAVRFRHQLQSRPVVEGGLFGARLADGTDAFSKNGVTGAVLIHEISSRMCKEWGVSQLHPSQSLDVRSNTNLQTEHRS
jgi:hypothetical protein